MDTSLQNLYTYTPPAKGSAAAYQQAMKRTDEAAQNFEGMFMSQMMQFMWGDSKSNEIFGGGHAEDMWHGMMVQEFGTLASKAGGLGIADQVKAELLKVQERAGQISATPPAATEASVNTDKNVKETQL